MLHVRVKGKRRTVFILENMSVLVLYSVEESEMLDLSRNHISNVTMSLKFPETEV